MIAEITEGWQGDQTHRHVNQWGCVCYVAVFKSQGKPFRLATQLYPQDYNAGRQLCVKFTYAHSTVDVDNTFSGKTAQIDNLQNYCLGMRYSARSLSRLCRWLSSSLIRHWDCLEKFLQHNFLPIRRSSKAHDLSAELLRVQCTFFWRKEGRSFREETMVHGPQGGSGRSKSSALSLFSLCSGSSRV